ncbi:HtaA domain-containing protein [Glycomyces dulcitolivorans]|uniref:HtaA domain-containing protein n=1 Tax=Glycomyces dulcitolivorans TaxID=2200759 RepID=UPI000DD3211B|nr:HtaA domain-containing protein [Glycomyces dulcitolivorans]
MRAPTRKRIAAVAAIALGAGAVVGLASLPAQAQELAKYPIVDGQVTWGIKESFRNYVTGPIAGGAIEAVDGAVVNDDGTFTFKPVTGVSDLPNQATETTAPGGVHFTGHHGELDLTIEDVETVSDTVSYTGAIYADVTSGDEVFEDVHFADFEVGSWTWVNGYSTLTDAPVTLTADGAEAFAGFYKEGDALDPITIAVKTDMTDPIDDPTEEEPSSEDPTSDDPATEEPGGTVYDVTGGDADWGVKESFREYVVGPIAGGEITVAAPATENADGTYHFPDASGTFTAETCALDAAFAGGVNFSGHEGELDLDVADVRIASVDGGLAVFSGDTRIADVAVDELAISDGVVAVEGAAASVSADGVDFFGGFYTEGTELDAVSFTVEIDGAADTTCEPTGNPGGGDGSGGETTSSASGAGSPKLPVTGSPLTLVLAAAGALLAGGVAVTVLARRRAIQS